MTKTEIFLDVVDIVKHDSSSCRDKKGGDVEYYRAKITDDMDDEEFLFVMRSYIATFGLTGHLAFYQTQGRGRLGFEVMRYKDELYVTKCASYANVHVGDKIIAIDGIAIKDFGEKYSEFLLGESEERQGVYWIGLISFFHEMTVISGSTNTKEILPVVLSNSKNENSEEMYYCKQIRDDIVYMRLLDFNDEEKIQAMYKENDSLISKTPYLVIDVRANGGGTDTAFFPLFKYCLPEGKTLFDLDKSIAKAQTNHTERNCKSRLGMFEQYMKMDLPPETLKIIESMANNIRNNYGKGFVETEGYSDNTIRGKAIPKKVYIITDNECGSTGDAFVETMSISPKVVTVGRPTMGILDYSNCIEVEYGKYAFVYPTSRLSNIDKGICMARNGIPVKHYIEWTPEHLKRDVELEKVLELIDNN